MNEKKVNRDYTVEERDFEIKVDASCRYSLWTLFVAWLKNENLHDYVTIKLPPARGTGMTFKITKVDSSPNPVLIAGEMGSGPTGIFCRKSEMVMDVEHGLWEVITND